MSAALTCDEAEALLPLVADGSLDDSGDPALFAHLATCERCQESLASHDLVTVALESAARDRARPALRPRPRPAWQRWAPVAAAAALVVGSGLALGSGSTADGSQPGHPVETTAQATHGATTAHPVAASPVAIAKPAAATPQQQHVANLPAVAGQQANANEPLTIDVEVVAVPGSRPSHPLYLVRKGEQVLLVDPSGSAAQGAPDDAVPASYTAPRRY